MPVKSDRLKELLGLLASLRSRPGMHPGEGSLDESRWAAIMIRDEFGEDAVRPLAGTLWFWDVLDPHNRDLTLVFGLRDPEIARRCKHRALAEVTWCLGRIPDSIPTLIGELASENGTLRACAALALGYLRATAAVEPLIDHLGDKDRKVVTTASSALKRITGKSFLFGAGDPRKWRAWWTKKKSSAAEQTR